MNSTKKRKLNSNSSPDLKTKKINDIVTYEKPTQYIELEQVSTPSRIFRIYDVPEYENWITKKMPFYKSTGTGNPLLKDIYKNTWIPFYGLSTEDGLVIKSLTLLQNLNIKQCSNLIWKNSLCTLEYDNHTDNLYNINNEINLNTNISDLSPEIKFAFENIDEEIHNQLEKFLDLYFIKYWQLQISAFIGGGYWETTEYLKKLRLFVLSYTYKIEDIDELNNWKNPKVIWTPTNTIFSTTYSKPEHGYNLEYKPEVINDYLQNNNALEPDLIKYKDFIDEQNIEVNPDIKRYLIQNVNAYYQRFKQTIRVLKLLNKNVKGGKLRKKNNKTKKTKNNKKTNKIIY
jgi:hypothetical protein